MTSDKVEKIHDLDCQLNWQDNPQVKAEEREIYHYLDGLGLDFKSFHHEAAPTVEHVAALEQYLEGRHCKNLFMRNSRGDQHYLVIAPHDKPLDMKLVARAIPSTRLSFAQPEILLDLMGLTPGSVTPFGLIRDKDRAVKVILDTDILSFDGICFHPGNNEATTTISLESLLCFLKSTGHAYQYITVPPRV